MNIFSITWSGDGEEYKVVDTMWLSSVQSILVRIMPERGAFGAAGPALTRGGRSRDAPLDVDAPEASRPELSATHDPHALAHCTRPRLPTRCDSRPPSTVPSARRTFELFAVSALAYKYELQWRGLAAEHGASRIHRAHIRDAAGVLPIDFIACLWDSTN